MSRLELHDHVRVKDTCPNAFYRGKRGQIVRFTYWGEARVEIHANGKKYTPVIANGHLQKIAPESEVSA